MNGTLRQLRSFRAVAEARGFGRAARALGASQPVVSGHVRELERELGVALFHRTTRRVALTEEGAAFLAEAEVVLDRLAGAVERVRGLAQARVERLLLAAPPLLAASLLPSAMATFAAAHPAVRLGLLDAPTEAIVAALGSGRVDAAVGTVPETVEVGSRSVILRDRLIVFAGAGSSVAGMEAMDWSELAARDLILLTPGSGIRALVDRELVRHGAVVEPAHEVTNVMTVLAMVEAGLGLSILPSYAATGLGGRAIRAVPLRGAPVEREIALVTPPGQTPAPAAADFARILRRHARRIGGGPQDRARRASLSTTRSEAAPRTVSPEGSAPKTA